jgi:gas vesicle protein
MLDYQASLKGIFGFKIFGTLFLCDSVEGVKKQIMNTTIKFAVGFLVGSVCGLATGLLLAPTTGKQTRKKLTKKSKKLAKKLAGYIGMEDEIPGATVRATAKRKDGKSQVEA